MKLATARDRPVDSGGASLSGPDEVRRAGWLGSPGLAAGLVQRSHAGVNLVSGWLQNSCREEYSTSGREEAVAKESKESRHGIGGVTVSCDRE
jgi:hypothetical protein